MARSSSVIIRDRGWRRIKAQVDSLHGTAVDVGVPADAGTGENGTPVAEYAAYNEFGTATIPERSFLRSTMDQQEGEIASLTARLMRLVYGGTMTGDRLLATVGKYVEDKVVDTIDSVVPPPNAPATVKAKGHSKTLINSGLLRRSIKWKRSKR